MLDIDKIRNDFPILHRTVHDKNLVYLDNGATTQKPIQVIEMENNIYRNLNSNIHRGVHYLSGQCTELYENARQTVQQFINAPAREEVIFTAGTTAAINLVAWSFGERFVRNGDEILISEMEHHSNIVPWQLLCDRKGAILKVLPFNDEGDLQLEKLDDLLSERTRIVAVTQISNVLGTINPIDKIIEKAHERDIPVLIDGAQGIQHGGIDVQESDCDFYVFSGHKIYAPTGIGILYSKQKWLEQMPPWQGGGDMIDQVRFAKTTYAPRPLKFEAGTSNYVGAIALGAALNYLTSTGIVDINIHEAKLLDYATKRISEIEGIKFYGTAKHKTSILCFLMDSIHPYDIGMILDKLGIAVRTGHLCADPIMQHYGIEGMVRASFAFYNTFDEVEKLYD
ncbi:MAG: SufS family cysteine desulfurase, partial [Prevotellaceae bacterium]|nr:SufS family cysteine desulfurase [Prevotellaceae bacterium]